MNKQCQRDLHILLIPFIQFAILDQFIIKTCQTLTGISRLTHRFRQNFTGRSKKIQPVCPQLKVRVQEPFISQFCSCSAHTDDWSCVSLRSEPADLHLKHEYGTKERIISKRSILGRYRISPETPQCTFHYAKTLKSLIRPHVMCNTHVMLSEPHFKEGGIYYLWCFSCLAYYLGSKKWSRKMVSTSTNSWNVRERRREAKMDESGCSKHTYDNIAGFRSLSNTHRHAQRAPPSLIEEAPASFSCNRRGRTCTRRRARGALLLTQAANKQKTQGSGIYLALPLQPSVQPGSN